MNDSTTAVHLDILQSLLDRLNYWFLNPDPIAVRATLAATVALDLGVRPAWLMLVGVPSIGKTEIHFPYLRGYRSVVETSDINVPGLFPMKDTSKPGLLERIGVKGLWLIKDFSSILGAGEEQRNKLFAAMRDIHDGHYGREGGTGRKVWRGRVNVIAAATPAIEHYHRMMADLGDRFVTIRLKRPDDLDRTLWERIKRQQSQFERMRSELEALGQQLFRSSFTMPDVPREWEERIQCAAALAARGRAPVYRDKYNHNLLDISSAEGASRLMQQFAAVIVGDAALHGQSEVGETQRELLYRLTYDTMPVHRGNILRYVTDSTPVQRCELFRMSGEKWDTTFERTLDELQAIGIMSHSLDKGETYWRLDETCTHLIQVLSKRTESE